MTVLVYANEQANDILSKMDTFLTGTLPLLEDDSIPLDDRWELYIKIEKLLPVSRYLTKSLRVLTDRPYDDFFGDGRGMLYNSDIDEVLAQDGEYAMEQKVEAIEAGIDFVPDKYTRRNLEMYEKRDAWREFVLSEGYSGCVFDW